jgi:hypothetical protein
MISHRSLIASGITNAATYVNVQYAAPEIPLADTMS